VSVSEKAASLPTSRATTWAIKFLFIFLVGGGIGGIAFALIPPETTSKLITSRSDWQKLSPDEQLVLAPLADKWASLNGLQREKWRSVARKFEHLSQSKKDRAYRRMTKWSALGSAQKNIARQNFKALNRKPPRDKEKALAAWAAYSNSGNKPPEVATSPLQQETEPDSRWLSTEKQIEPTDPKEEAIDSIPLAQTAMQRESGTER
jgi:hypothetical protein